MLKTIEPYSYECRGSSVDSLLSYLKIYQGFYFSESELEKAAFIIAEDEEHNVYGGAVLYPRKVRSLYEKIGKVITNFEPTREEVWVAQVCFCLDYDESYLTLETLELCQTFFLNLYESLCKFGNAKGIDFIVLSLRPHDYFYSKNYGSWPYILEIKPRETSDRRFHGILNVNNKHKQGFHSPSYIIPFEGYTRELSLAPTHEYPQ